MAVLTGIDLLAKHHDGSDSVTGGAIGRRFKTFVDAFMNSGDGDMMWQLRNARYCTHSACILRRRIPFRRRSAQDCWHIFRLDSALQQKTLLQSRPDRYSQYIPESLR